MLREKIVDCFMLRFRHGNRYTFLRQLSPDAKILDVGCGNNSLFHIRQVLSQCTYTGVDIFEDASYLDGEREKYVIAPPEEFDSAIAAISGEFDAVISSHNLEHCNDREKTLLAMLGRVAAGGRIFLSFPSEASVDFPSRGGTLNYYDDPTHVGEPPDFRQIVGTIRDRGFEIEFADPGFRPFVDRIRGAISERRSRKENRLMAGTWSYYGFEAIIWARNPGLSK